MASHLLSSDTIEHWSTSLVPSNASFPPVLCFVTKLLVCWCTSDPESAALAIDTGYLVLGGGQAAMWSYGHGEVINAMRLVTLELLFVHLALECLFYGVVLPRVASRKVPAMTTDMWVHHLASLVAGIYCRLAGPWIWTEAMRLSLTECTIAFPVSFKLARKSNMLGGKRAVAISLMLLAAYAWRVLWSASVARNFYNLTMDRIAKDPSSDSLW
eukprot:CAMPEP_0114238284 /NCGR_PEP_ID=MMETSP0058-20121206/7843_1 /TAXON_ID=36894 /ORGANISM="Pyramimonas parkeae, CCMP726" /LENGTH=213 /DNA_ID=CAMNT_0001350385 /DNA_START=281 /DNA_END=919 /DNA_ORIENTATION=-